MRVVLAPDSFTGTLSATEAAQALAEGWRRARPADDLVLLPMSDGGPGFLDALPGTAVSALVRDPLGRPTVAQFLLDGRTAYVEAAAAAGLHLLDPAERDPWLTTTHGVGELVRAAVDAGAERVVVGLGGTGSNDGGEGFVQALGDVAVDLVAATDVDNPLLGSAGATAVYGPQKGMTPEQQPALEARLEAWADVLEGRTGRAVRDQPGAGAAGGLGFALLALGATRVAGADVVAEALGLADKIASADLVVTGEGCLDGQSTRGKVVAAVAARALAAGVPCVAVAGQVRLGRREAGAAGLAETVSLVELAGLERALGQAAAALADAGAKLAAEWSH
jgi:glycerate kinase